MFQDTFIRFGERATCPREYRDIRQKHQVLFSPETFFVALGHEKPEQVARWLGKVHML